MELCHIKDDVHYVPGAVNIGVIAGQDGQAILIDSGIGDHSGRQILQLLASRGLRPVAILNTHGHGDHVGGNAYIVERSGAKVYAPLLDSVILQYPVWGTLFLFGGAEPIQELAVPRYSPRPCTPDVLVTDGEYDIAGMHIRAIPLPGHTGGHTGYLVEDVLFSGDTLASEQELNDRRVVYAYSITKRLESLKRLQGLSCAWYLLSHDIPRRDIGELVTRNIAQVEDTLRFILGYLANSPAEANDILDALCQRYDIHLRHLRDYSLLSLTAFAYLSHLHNSGEIAYAIEGYRLRWCISRT